MTARTGSRTTLAAVTNRARGFWAYYRRYTNTAVHAAATAALTAFGLLIFIDPSFAWLAIASYLLPPVVLYAIGSDAGAEDEDDPDRSTPVSRSARNGESVGTDSDGSSAAVADEDRDGVDHDYDGPDLDYDGPDADADGPDRDYDGPDRDADGSDGDADGPDRDADGADHDHDGVDRDADGTDADSNSVDVDRDG